MKIRHLATVASLVLTTSFCGGGGGYGTGSGGGGGGGGDCTPGNGTICVTTANTFNPSAVTIAKGSTLTWSNTTGVTHTVTFDAVTGAPPSDPSFASGTFTATFNTAGTFPYHCLIHGTSMSGTITVQ
jgi:hypothetical protein